MDSQIASPHGHNNEDDPHAGEEPEKKSYLNKVKAKAKKIKDTFSKHGHGQGHDQGPDYHHVEPEPHDQYLDAEDIEDKEMVDEPEVHGAPIYDSDAARSAVPGQEENLGQPKVKSGRSTAMGEDLLSPKDRTEAFTAGNYQTKGTDPGTLGRSTVKENDPVNTPESFSPGINQTKVKDIARSFDHGQDENQKQYGDNFGRSTALEEDPQAPKDRSEAYSPSNYKTKVTVPTGAGGEEAGITPILSSFGKMSVHDEPEPKSGHILPTSTGSHNQFSPELSQPTKTTDFTENPQQVPKPQDQPYDNKSESPSKQSSYTEKLSFATSAITNAVGSKLGYGGKEDNAVPDMRERGDTDESSQVGECGGKSDATVTIPKEQPYDNKSESPSKQSSYTEKLSFATSAITNAVGSKLGYGGKEDNAVPDMRERGDTDESSQVGECGGKSDATVTIPKEQPYDNKSEASPNQSSYTEKLSSATYGITDKAFSAKNAVASKLGYGGKDDNAATGTDPVYDHDKVAENKGAENKGVSMKEYLVEKLRPGDEDKALSGVISDSFRKRKEENAPVVEAKGENEAEKANRPVTEVFSDALHRRKEEDEPEKVSRPMGKVTESEEVAKRLGTGDEKSGERVDSGAIVSPGKGVVDRLKGTVTSWFGKGEESPTSEASPGFPRGAEGFSSSASGEVGHGPAAGAEGFSNSTSGEVGHGHDVVGERRLNESSN